LITSVGPLDVPGSVEVSQNVVGALVQGPSERVELDQCFRDTAAERSDEVGHQLATAASVLVPVGGDHALIDAPGRLDLDMVLGREQRPQPGGLLVGEQVGAGVQGPPGRVERVSLHPAVAVDGLLHTPAAPVECVAGEADDVEGIHDRDRVGKFLGGRGLEAGEPVHRHNLDTVALQPRHRRARSRAGGEPGLERPLRAALNDVQQSCRPGAIADRGEVDDHDDVPVATPGVAPHVLIDADDLHAVEPDGVVDQDPLALGQDRVGGGVPGDVEPRMKVPTRCIRETSTCLTLPSASALARSPALT